MAEYDRKDRLYQKAKDEGYRSRAAYKLMELDGKYKFIKRNSKILDLGCWPGGWLQIAAQKIGPEGLIVGIDLQATDGFDQPNVKLITGDAREDENISKMKELSSGGFDVILSDLSPKLTGIKEADSAASIALGELAVFVASQVLNIGGTLVMKLFKWGNVESFVKSTRPLFNKVYRTELDSTRKTSNEFYVVFLGRKGA